MAFLTLFLGLITGVHPVEMTVPDPLIARIEIQLDGRTIGVLNGEPWSLTADLGDDLSPHELVALGFDSDGEQIADSRQWINMPRQRAEVELVLEGDPEGQVDSARLVWSSVDVAKPETAKVYLDGEELTGIDPSGFKVPSYNVTMPHLLQAEVLLGDTTARDQAVIGGGPGSAVSRALTAMVLYDDRGGRLPEPSEVQGWIEARGKPVRVVALERPGADVFMVQDLSWYLQKRLKGLRNEVLETRISARRRPTGLKSRDHFRLLFPVPQAATGATVRSLQFPMSPNLWTGQLIETHAQGAVDRQVADAMPQGLMVGIPVNGERKLDTSNQHLTDAVAVGALAAAQGQRGRVVLLIAGSDEKDQSRYSPEDVRSYLARLNVPLRVWSPEPERVEPGWGQVENIATRRRLELAMRDFRSLLDHQIVVWVEGLHLPHQLELTARAAGNWRRVTEVGPPPPPPGEDADLDPGLRIADMPAAAPAPAASPDAPAPAATATATTTTASPSPASPSVASFGETVDVNVVNIDVVVATKDGTRARNLTREDFRLFEDGDPVEITYFEGPPAAAEKAAGAAVGSPSRPMSLIVFIDLFRLGVQQRAQSLRALQSGLAKQTERVRTMIITHDGSIDIPLTFTESKDEVLATIAEVEARKPRPFVDSTRQILIQMAEVRQEIDDAHRIKDELARAAALRSAFSQRELIESQLGLVAGERMREVRDVVDSLERLALALSGVEGRRAVLYVGNRVNMSPGELLYEEAAELMADYTIDAARVVGRPEGTRQSRLLGEASRLRLNKDFNDMIRETSATGVAFYTLAPPHAGADLTWRGTAGGTAAAPSSTQGESIKSAACAMSGETGGLCQVGGSDMEQLLDATFEDFGTYYSLAYTPAREPDGKYHKLRVEVDRTDLELRYRNGYLDRPREDAVKDRLLAALTFGEELDELGMQLAMSPQEATDKEGLYLIPFEVRVSAQRLALLPVADGGKRQANARLMVTTMDGQGRTTGVQEYPIRFEVSEERLATGQPLLYAHKVRLTLAEGDQKVAVGIWDDVGRVGSFTSRELEVGAPSG